MISVVFCVTLLVCLAFPKNLIISLYTQDPAVVDILSDAYLLYLVLSVLQMAASTSLGFARGIGVQKTTAVISFFCYIVVGVVLGFVFSSALDMGVKGILLGGIVGLCCALALYNYFYYSLDLPLVVEKIYERNKSTGTV